MVILSVFLTIVGGWTLMVFRFFAQGAGFAYGEIFHKDWPILIGGVSALGATYSAYSQLGALWALGLAVAGVIGSFILLTVLKSWSGFLAFALILVGYLLLFFV